ncbi:MAG: hypothetical protein KME47_24425 [Nodosilinea sp. WJT8-NPBG4]|jgi:hypothetical protein|nr:hypothetical protein [Nodosilinea sp. WJT8-NPBG4]
MLWASPGWNISDRRAFKAAQVRLCEISELVAMIVHEVCSHLANRERIDGLG